jgi:ribonuclease R
MGADSGLTIGVGQKVTVRLAEAVPVTGGLVLDLVEIEGRAASAGAPAKRGRYAPRKPGKVAARDAKLARKIVRRRK